MVEVLASDEKSRVIYGPTILLSNGEYFDFLDPAASAWGVAEIATALGKVCRFAGHCNGFYSVAEHCLHVANLVPPEHRLEALLHDAAEAFTGDVTYPLKRLLGEVLKPIEQRIDAAIFDRFGVQTPLPGTVKQADRWMLWIEQRHAMGNTHQWSATLAPPEGALARVPALWMLPWDRAATAWQHAVEDEIAERAARSGSHV